MSIKFIRRAILCALLSTAALAHATSFPDRPIKLVVPFPPGGLVSAVALAIANKMSPVLGQPVVMDNKPGAAGTIAANAVAKAPKDGYTILFGTSSTQGIAKYMYKDLPYDPIEDFTPVGIVGNVTVGIFASEKSGIRTMEEMVAAIRAKPGQVNYGSPGVGSVSHLAAELFKSRARMDVLHVPYAGTVPQMTDLVGGQTQLGFTGLGSGITYVRDGRVRLLAVASRTRSRNYPNVPALGELIPGYDAPAWLGIVAPRGTPADVVDRLEKALQVALADRDIQALFANQGIEPEPMGAREFGDKMRREMPLWEEAVRAAGAGGAPAR